MANTTNFGWETPDDTDLVKDGAAAIRTLGSAIDTSLMDLEGGTTGQILAKNSNTDMDFVWVTNDVGDITEVVAGTGLSGGGSSGSVTLTNTVATEFDAKGDLVVGTGADTFDKLTAGTNDHRLVAASGEATGLKYVSDTQNTVIDAEGDLLVGDAADAVQRLAIGTTGQVLTVDTAVDGKIKWAAAGGASTFVGCGVKRTAAQSIANTTYTAIAFTAEDWDTDAIHDNSTNNTRLTVPSGKGGKWEISGVVTYAEQTGYRNVRIYKNGSGLVTLISMTGVVGDNTGLPVSYVLNLSAGDYIEVYTYQNSGVSLNVQFADTNIQFTYLGA
jgi:hypothetical protein